jgi:hypothetical protein
MIKRYKQFNEGLLDFLKSNKFEYEIDPNYKVGDSERKLGDKIGIVFQDCLQDILDEYSAEFKYGVRLKCPVLVNVIHFPDLIAKSESIDICREVGIRIDKAIDMLDVDVSLIFPHLGYLKHDDRRRPVNPNAQPRRLVTYKLDKAFDKSRFFIIDNLLVFETIENGVSKTSIYFSILNPYYSEFNYGK